MNLTNAFGAEFREVRDATRDGQEVRVVCGHRTFDTDIHDLWDAVTNPERLQRWFSPVSGDLKLGGQYQVEGNAGGEIIRCDPPEALDITWEMMGNTSWVAIRLEPVGQGTRLTLEHIIGKDDESEEHWVKYGPGATGVGWDLSFLGLGMYVPGNEMVDKDVVFAWMAADEGKAFLRKCAEAWGDAHIAAGENPDTARAMAQRTGDFYTGA